MVSTDWRIYRGRVIKELGIRRSDLVITTKLFWGLGSGPNDGGLSRKQWVHLSSCCTCLSIVFIVSIIEGTQAALQRLQMDYVDVIFAHRPDKTGGIQKKNVYNQLIDGIFSADRGDCPRV